MSPINYKLLVLAITAGAVSACSTAPAGLANASMAAPVPTAVYIVPNCQVVGAQRLCHWIDPPAREQPTESRAKPVNGIAL